MQRSSQALYSKHPSGQVQPTGKLFDVIIPGRDWTPTVVNPSEEGGLMQTALFYFHILIWVVAVGLSATTNLGVGMLQAANCGGPSPPPGASVVIDAPTAAPTAAPTVTTASRLLSETTTTVADAVDCFMADPTQTTITIGLMGGVSSILGVVAILGGATFLEAKHFRMQVWLTVLIQFFTLFGTCATTYVFSRAAMHTETVAYWIGLFAVLISSYAQTLLYCTSAGLDVLALPRAFMPCAAVALQLISAIAIQGDEFHAAQGHPFTTSQKAAAWALPSTLSAAILFMIVIRRWTRDSNEISQLGDHPFKRSLVLYPFLTAAALSTYKLSYLKQDDDPVSYMFGLAGMLLTYAIVTLVFVPSGMSFGSA